MSPTILSHRAKRMPHRRYRGKWRPPRIPTNPAQSGKRIRLHPFTRREQIRLGGIAIRLEGPRRTATLYRARKVTHLWQKERSSGPQGGRSKTAHVSRPGAILSFILGVTSRRLPMPSSCIVILHPFLLRPAGETRSQPFPPPRYSIHLLERFCTASLRPLRATRGHTHTLEHG